MDGQEDSLDLASRLFSILLELCEVEVFLLSWPGPSHGNILRAAPEAALAIALEGISCDWLERKQMKSRLCIL